MLIKLIYTLFLGLLLAAFVGMGIAAFYSKPKAPEYPAGLKSEPVPTVQTTVSPEDKHVLEQFDQQQKDYITHSQLYNRNVSILALGAAIVFLAVSLSLFQRLKEISDGILLGGVFTLLYSIGRGFASADTKYSFILVTIGLIVGFVLGYLKFIKHELHAAKA